ELLSGADFPRVHAEAPEHVGVLQEVALQGENADGGHVLIIRSVGPQLARRAHGVCTLSAISAAISRSIPAADCPPDPRAAEGAGSGKRGPPVAELRQNRLR